MIQHWMSDPQSHRSLLIITQPWPECGRCPTLSHSNEGNLTVRHKEEFKQSHLCDAVSRLEPSTPKTVIKRPSHSSTELPNSKLPKLADKPLVPMRWFQRCNYASIDTVDDLLTYRLENLPAVSQEIVLQILKIILIRIKIIRGGRDLVLAS